MLQGSEELKDFFRKAAKIIKKANERREEEIMLYQMQG